MRKEELLKKANKSKARIGIGAGSERLGYTEKVIKSAKETDCAEVVVIGEKIQDSEIQSITTEKPSYHLIKLLKEGKIDAAVRGSLSAEKTLYAIKEFFGIDDVYRVALLETKYPEEKLFFLSPIGIDEGNTLKEKKELVKRSTNLFKELNIQEKIGLLSGGRKEDFGRSEKINKALKESKKLMEELEEENFNVENFNILIEDAVKQANFLVPPNGIIGNYIFRTLTFLGGGKGIGAPILNIKKTYVDTSRASKDYIDSLVFAAALTSSEK